jgi:hypothetical protein
MANQVTQADIDAAMEFLSSVHNNAQMLNALSQLRPEVVKQLSDMGRIPTPAWLI